MSKHRAVILVAAGLATAAIAPRIAAAQGTLPQFRLQGLADARAFATGGEPGWLDEGLGKARYGGDDDGGDRAGAALADLSVVARADWTWSLSSHLHLQFAPEQETAVDVVEAWVGYRPAPRSAYTFSARGGLYYPHISREHTGPAWTSPYTITPSAVNSWVGEEVRDLGGEIQLGRRWERSRLTVTLGLFGFNDPTGTLLAYRGWAMGDVKVGAFGKLPLAPLPSIGAPGAFMWRQGRWDDPVVEIDGRVGHHVAVDWARDRRLQAGLFYYDNNGDPRVMKHNQYAWDTRFWNFYLEAEPRAGLTLVSQYMTGVTQIGWRKSNGQLPVDVGFTAWFALASQRWGRHCASLRYDWFETEDNSFVVEDDNNEYGDAWTLAIGRDLGPRDRIMLEYLRIDSERPAREALGYDEEQVQDLVQLAFRRLF